MGNQTINWYSNDKKRGLGSDHQIVQFSDAIRKTDHTDVCFVQVFCTSLNGNTNGTKYQLSQDKSSGLVKLAK